MSLSVKQGPYMTILKEFPILQTPCESGLTEDDNLWVVRIVSGLLFIACAVGAIYTFYYFLRQFYVFVILG